LRNGFKIILNIMTIAWLLGVEMVSYYSDVSGPGVYMGGAMVDVVFYGLIRNNLETCSG
jgi:hypothetical protein